MNANYQKMIFRYMGIVLLLISGIIPGFADEPPDSLNHVWEKFQASLDTELGDFQLPNNYIVGPGDEISIYLSGSEHQVFDVKVNLENKILLPTVGIFSVAGLSLPELKQVLNTAIARFYVNYELELLLKTPRNVRIAVTGEIRQPGYYVLNSLSSVITALNAAGGPTAIGSLRNIQLWHTDSMQICDLYPFFFQGKPLPPIQLSRENRFFVPNRQQQVSITGEVNRSGQYELRMDRKNTLAELFSWAGELTAFAETDRIEISRKQTGNTLKLMYINLAETAANTVILRHDDQVTVYSILHTGQELAVYIQGEIQQPGKYRWQQNMHIADLIQMANGLNRGAYLPVAELARIDPVQPTHILKFNLAEILENPNSAENVQLQPDDAVFIRTIPNWQIGPTVTISGEVEFPGTYSISRDRTLLSHVIHQAGGFTSRAMLREASVIRQRQHFMVDKEYERLKTIPRDQLTDDEYDYLVMKQNHQDVHRINVNFFRLFSENETAEDIILRDGDKINVPEKPRVIQVTGRVSTPGGVLYVPGQKLAYYLEKAGSTTWDADIRKTKITRANGEIVSYRKVDKIAPGDIIWVPRKKRRDWWALFRDTMLITTQIATVWLIIENIQK